MNDVVCGLSRSDEIVREKFDESQESCTKGGWVVSHGQPSITVRYKPSVTNPFWCITSYVLLQG